MTCDEAKELITALVDQESLDPERSSLEVHMQECARCRSALAEERALKQATRAVGMSIRAPSELRDRILSDPRIFPGRRPARRWQDSIWPTPHILRPAFVAALLLIVALAAFYLYQQRSTPIALAAVETYDLFLKGELSVQPMENTKEIVAKLTHAVGGRFHPMGYDLTSMNLRPVAGLVREIQGRKILVAIYQGEGGSLFCYTFLGSEEDAPANAARFFDTAKNMNFYAFSRGEVNAVFHREGEVICILASNMPMKELLALAQSKAKSS
ncbi:MAG TPA: zf-HC2 domain-containing protein [Candidatus Binatia bacterium]|nr:zf-HC2 domain-containing protein [Candidatus Binatia bacterium]